MKKNLLLLSLVALGGSISAMQKQNLKELEERVKKCDARYDSSIARQIEWCDVSFDQLYSDSKQQLAAECIAFMRKELTAKLLDCYKNAERLKD